MCNTDASAAVVAIQVAAYFLELVILGMPLIMMMIYYWSKLQPNVPMTFMFGLKFESKWFPWVLVAFTTLTGGNPLFELLGIAVGHVYFFLNDMYPRINNGRVLLRTPQFLYVGFFSCCFVRACC